MDYVVACNSRDVLKLIKSVTQVDSSYREGASGGSCKLHAVQVVRVAEWCAESITTLDCCLTQLSSSKFGLGCLDGRRTNDCRS